MLNFIPRLVILGFVKTPMWGRAQQRKKKNSCQC